MAHAIVIKSNPAVDATVASTSVPIALRFNSRIDQERSRVTLYGPDGKSATLPLAPSTSPDLLTGTASGLAPGAHFEVLSFAVALWRPCFLAIAARSGSHWSAGAPRCAII